MRCSRLKLVGSILAIVALAPFGYLHAEVQGPRDDAPAYLLLMGIIEDADPVGIVWDSFTDWEAQILNLNGLARNDGPPDFGFGPGGSVSVVWAYNAGTDYDIAFSQWDQGQWLLTEFLTSGLEDDLDPRIDLDPQGNAFVVYWSPGPPETISLVVHAAGGSEWSVPEVIITDGRRPAVAALDGLILVAFERDAPGGGQELVVQTRPDDAPSSELVIASTPSTAPLYVLLHSLRNHVWMEWIHGDNLFGYSEYVDGVWVAPSTIEWDDLTWFDLEQARRVIQSQVLSP